MKEWKNILTGIIFGIVLLLSIYLTWHLKPAETDNQYKPETVMVYTDISNVLRDSIVQLNKSFLAKILNLEKQLSIEKNRPPKEVYITDTFQVFSFHWEWIIKVHRTVKGCTVWTFVQDTLFMNRNSLDSIMTDIASINILRLISEGNEPEVSGKVKKYWIPIPEKEFVITSKKVGVFAKGINRSVNPFRLMVGMGINGTIVNQELDMKDRKVNADLWVDLWCKDWFALSSSISTNYGWIIGIKIPMYKLGRD